MQSELDFPPVFKSFAAPPEKPVEVTASSVSPVDSETRRLSIMSYELKFSPGGYYSHLKPDPKHPVYDP